MSVAYNVIDSDNDDDYELTVFHSKDNVEVPDPVLVPKEGADGFHAFATAAAAVDLDLSADPEDVLLVVGRVAPAPAPASPCSYPSPSPSPSPWEVALRFRGGWGGHGSPQNWGEVLGKGPQ